MRLCKQCFEYQCCISRYQHGDGHFHQAEKEVLSNVPTDSGLGNYENIRYRLFEEMGLEYVDRKTVMGKFRADGRDCKVSLASGIEMDIYEWICDLVYDDLKAILVAPVALQMSSHELRNRQKELYWSHVYQQRMAASY